MSRTLTLYQYRRLLRYGILLDFSGPSSEVSKYQDPLHILQDYVAEVSSAGPTSYLCCIYVSDLDMNIKREPDCDMILIHDDDLGKIDELRHGAVSEHLIGSRAVQCPYVNSHQKALNQTR